MLQPDLHGLSASDHGYTVDDDDDDDPVLLDRRGAVFDTWRENYPYDHRMVRGGYEMQKRLLQIELLKLQKWSQNTGARHVILFEGRDAAGKGGTIKRFMEHLNPRGASSLRWISPHWTSGTLTPPPRRTCSAPPTPTLRRGSSSSAMTRNAPGSTPCAICSPSSTTTARLRRWWTCRIR